MTLPIRSLVPMEARQVSDLPEGQEWQYEPKWDGFRCIAIRDGKKVELQSKASRSLTRYFPEIVEALEKVKAGTFVLDGELLVPVDGRLSFDDLLQRIHPAASRGKMLSQTQPAQLVIFDLLVDDSNASLLGLNLEKRRPRLESFYKRYLKGNERIVLSRKTVDPDVAKTSLKELRGQLDGVIAKRLDQPYLPGERAI